jgi:GNAT superfamily N-acetyltransferase
VSQTSPSSENRPEGIDALRVREARLDDQMVIVEFNVRLALETEATVLDPERLAQGVRIALTEPDRLRYWVAERDGRVVGQTAITREWSDWRNGWIWWIQSVYVRADQRRRGILRALFDAVYLAARSQPDIVGLRLYVERENHPAQQTYSRLGLEATSYLVFERCPLG